MPVTGENFVFGGLSSSAVPAAPSSTRLLDPNPERKALIISNFAPNVLFVRFGAAVTSANFQAMIAANERYTFPQPVPSGSVFGMWASASNGPLATSGSAMCLDIS